MIFGGSEALSVFHFVWGDGQWACGPHRVVRGAAAWRRGEKSGQAQGGGHLILRR